MSGIFANATAAAYESDIQAVAYAVAITQASLTLSTRGFQGSVEEATLLLISGRQLGGLKTSDHVTFCIRGINDPVTTGLSLMMTTYQNRDKHAKLWGHMQRFPIKAGKSSGSKFLKILTQYLLLGYRTLDIELKSIVKDVLPQETRDINLLKLLSQEAERQEDNLVKTLQMIRPMSLKLGGAILQHSNIAIRERIIGGFQAASSILVLAAKYSIFRRIRRPPKFEDKILI